MTLNAHRKRRRGELESRGGERDSVSRGGGRETEREKGRQIKRKGEDRERK